MDVEAPHPDSFAAVDRGAELVPARIPVAREGLFVELFLGRVLRGHDLAAMEVSLERLRRACEVALVLAGETT